MTKLKLGPLIDDRPVKLSIDFTVQRAAQWITGLAIASAILLVLGILALVLLFRMKGRKGRHQGHLPDGADVVDG